ncbi:hypothetical protein C4D60_Mb04t16460 [Musa balbisiana]|uniref:Cullin N-terminal domain-containing protein n=1 Tax=Musa balbisiana TaxID=52838 RepID=A0A4S8KCI4_MUSBA|nr:hypothetical protein C4D60_Mb04t16460 [Musa balbisiana]
MAMHERKTIDLEQGWEFMQKGITKLKNILEGLPESQFSSEDYMMLYTTIYNMCTQKPPHDYSQQLYDKYRESCDFPLPPPFSSPLLLPHLDRWFRGSDPWSGFDSIAFGSFPRG